MESSTAAKDERWRARVSEIAAAVASAVAKYGKKPEPEPEEQSARSSFPAGRPARLQTAHTVFRKWLDQGYDIDVLDAVLAAAASERLTGDPLWSGSSAFPVPAMPKPKPYRHWPV